MVCRGVLRPLHDHDPTPARSGAVCVRRALSLEALAALMREPVEGEQHMFILYNGGEGHAQRP